MHNLNECSTDTLSAPTWSTVFNTENAEARISTHGALQISYRNIHLIGKLRTLNHSFPLPYSTPFSIELKKLHGSLRGCNLPSVITLTTR